MGAGRHRPSYRAQRPVGDRAHGLGVLPQVGEPVDHRRRRVAGDHRAVQRPDAGAEHQVGGDLDLEQRPQHPDLGRPEHPTATEHERRRHGVIVSVVRDESAAEGPERQPCRRGLSRLGASSGCSSRIRRVTTCSTQKMTRGIRPAITTSSANGHRPAGLAPQQERDHDVGDEDPAVGDPQDAPRSRRTAAATSPRARSGAPGTRSGRRRRAGRRPPWPAPGRRRRGLSTRTRRRTYPAIASGSAARPPEHVLLQPAPPHEDREGAEHPPLEGVEQVAQRRSRHRPPAGARRSPGRARPCPAPVVPPPGTARSVAIDVAAVEVAVGALQQVGDAQLGQDGVGGVVVGYAGVLRRLQQPDQGGRGRAARPVPGPGRSTQPRTTGISEPEARHDRGHHPVARCCPSRSRPETKTVPPGSQVPSTVDRSASAVAGVRRVRAEHGVERHRRQPRDRGGAVRAVRRATRRTASGRGAPSPPRPPPSAGGRPSSAGRAPAPRGGRRGRTARGQATQR